MSFTSRGLYRFDGFELDAFTRVLTRNNTPIPLTPKTIDVLEYLVLNAGRIVMKEELIQAVWPNAFVEENNLTQHISALRKALADKSGWIVTYSGRGYQFTAQVQVEYPVDSLPESQPGDIFVQRVRERTHVVFENSPPPAPLALPAGTPFRRHIPIWWMGVGILATALIALVAPSLWKHFSKPPQLRTVMVADFADATGDATFDRTLKRALEIDLEQTPYIDVMSEREVVGTLHQMGREDTSAIAPGIAREICERSNRQVLLTGSIAPVGQEYLLMLQATDCVSGKMLSGAKAEAPDKEKVLAALDTVANRVRQDLGESAESLERFQVPIAQATTSSLDALEQYSTGEYLLGRMGKEENEVLPFFQRALALDPHFAMASVAIATGYFNLGEPNLAAPYYQRAFDLSNRISEKERLYIRAHYYADDIRDIRQGIQTYRMWAEIYPRDWGPWLNIAILYTQLGQFDEAISAAQHALALDANHGIVYGVLARDYMRLNRYAEAQSTAQRALAIGMDSSLIHATLFETALLQQDQSALSREIAWSRGKDVEWEFLDLQALAAAKEGRLKHTEELFGAAYDSAQREGLSETADDILLDQARMEFEFGLPAASRDTLSRLHNLGATSLELAILRVQLGDTSVAQRYMAEHNPDTHSGTLMEYVYLPRLRAELAIERGKPLEAITALEPATPYELADYNVLMQRAGAYLQAGQPGMAVHDYLKVLANRGVDPVSALYPLAQLGVARAYAMENDKVVSRSEYEKFFNSWKDADADLPVLKQAHLEFARLK
jgi:DNA-binding winged helix-turn-helix (wHTH) protein/Tfp pilus assembly protein PilF